MNSPTAHAPGDWVLEFILLAAIWGASFLCMRLGAVEFGPLPTVGLRIGIAALFLLPIALARWPMCRFAPALAAHPGNGDFQ